MSTSTAILEFSGMHGIDAVPATLQSFKNFYQGLRLSKEMAIDALSYTLRYRAYKQNERAKAAEVFNGPVQAVPSAA